MVAAAARRVPWSLHPKLRQIRSALRQEQGCRGGTGRRALQALLGFSLGGAVFARGEGGEGCRLVPDPKLLEAVDCHTLLIAARAEAGAGEQGACRFGL